MKTTNFRTRVFKWAYELMTATGKSFAVCLSKAWALYRLRKRMTVEVVKITFEKVDGSLRIAKATLKNTSTMVKGTGTPNYKTLSYYDVEKRGFRCFRIENLIAIY